MSCQVPPKSTPRPSAARGSPRGAHSRFRDRPRGFTLLEVLLTLALIVIVAALVAPAFDKPLAAQQLRSAAQKVREQWNRARVAAIASGRIHVFRYAPEDRKFRISPHSFDPEGGGDQGNPGGISGSSSGAGTAGSSAGPAATTNPGAASGASSASPANSPILTLSDSLSEGITFLPPRTTDDGGDTALPVPQDTGADAGFAPPIFFFPDGTSSTTKVGIKNQYDKALTLSLRGLTGVGTISEMQTVQEAGQ